MTTVCVSKLTIGVILDLKSQNRIPKLKNLILYDLAEDLHITLASQVGFQIFQFDDMVKDGFRCQDVEKQEPKADDILLLGVTSGTTGEPKAAMLTHVNFISGQVGESYLGFGMAEFENDVYLSYVPLTHVQE